MRLQSQEAEIKSNTPSDGMTRRPMCQQFRRPLRIRKTRDNVRRGCFRHLLYCTRNSTLLCARTCNVLVYEVQFSILIEGLSSTATTLRNRVNDGILKLQSQVVANTKNFSDRTGLIGLLTPVTNTLANVQVTKVGR